jgi:hypothetical protein
MTNRTFSFPDLDGTLVLTTGAQTLSDKTVDNSNNITVVDSNFVIEDTAGGNSALFDANSLSVDRTFSFPDLTGTFVLTSGAQTINDKILADSNAITVVDSNFAIEDTAGGNSALFNANALSGDHTFSFPDLTGTFVLTSGAQTINDKILADSNAITVVDSNFAIEDTAGGNSALFNADSLTGDNTFSFPDLTDTFLLTTGAQTVSGKTLDNTNSITVTDSNFAIENGIGDQAHFDASDITGDNTYLLPDQRNCTLVCKSDIASYTRGFFATGAPSVPNSAYTVLTYSSTGGAGTGRNNVGGYFSTGTGGFTAPYNGYYSFTVTAEFGASTGGTQRTLYLTQGGSVLFNVLGKVQSGPVSLASISVRNVHAYITAGTVVNTVALQDSGSSMTVGCSFSGTFVAIP